MAATLSDTILNLASLGYVIQFETDLGMIQITVKKNCDPKDRRYGEITQRLPYDHMTDEKLSGCIKFCEGKLFEKKKS